MTKTELRLRHRIDKLTDERDTALAIARVRHEQLRRVVPERVRCGYCSLPLAEPGECGIPGVHMEATG